MAYVDVAGLATYYEVSGAGEPVVLLHGAFGGAASWYQQRPALVAAGFQVWTPERRGHAHTADTEAPFSYESMAQETIGFLESAVGGAAHLVGWSDGAVVGALVAMQRPDLVRRLVLIGQYYDEDGMVPDGIAAQIDAVRADPPAFLRQGYDPFSPDGPEHFPVVFAKTLAMFDAEPRIPVGEFGAVTAQTLVLQGDHDEVRLEHSAAVVAALPDGRLAVLPGTHALPLESPELVNPLIANFLRFGPPAPM